jgi:hypothetical protein
VTASHENIPERRDNGQAAGEQARNKRGRQPFKRAPNPAVQWLEIESKRDVLIPRTLLLFYGKGDF